MDSAMSGQQTQADTHSCSDKFIRVDSDSGEGELCNLIAMKQASQLFDEKIKYLVKLVSLEVTR